VFRKNQRRFTRRHIRAYDINWATCTFRNDISPDEDRSSVAATIAKARGTILLEDSVNSRGTNRLGGAAVMWTVFEGLPRRNHDGL